MPVVELNPVEPKDPSESKIYTMDWTGALNSGATISASAWASEPSGLTHVGDGIVSGNLKTTLQVSGGSPDQDYDVTNTVTTSDSETLVRTGVIQCREL